MKAELLPEPELEFRGGNRHIDPRFGIMEFGPADADTPAAPTQITVGLVGPRQALDGIRRWLDRCRSEVKGKPAKPGQDNMFPDFPGFNDAGAFCSELVFDDSLVRELPDQTLRRFTASPSASSVSEAADLYADAARSLSETGRCRVIICARPDELGDTPVDSGPAEEESVPQARARWYHHCQPICLLHVAPSRLLERRAAVDRRLGWALGQTQFSVT